MENLIRKKRNVELFGSVLKLALIVVCVIYYFNLLKGAYGITSWWILILWVIGICLYLLSSLYYLCLDSYLLINEQILDVVEYDVKRTIKLENKLKKRGNENE